MKPPKLFTPNRITASLTTTITGTSTTLHILAALALLFALICAADLTPVEDMIIINPNAPTIQDAYISITLTAWKFSVFGMALLCTLNAGMLALTFWYQKPFCIHWIEFPLQLCNTLFLSLMSFLSPLMVEKYLSQTSEIISEVYDLATLTLILCLITFCILVIRSTSNAILEGAENAEET